MAEPTPAPGHRGERCHARGSSGAGPRGRPGRPRRPVPRRGGRADRSAAASFRPGGGNGSARHRTAGCRRRATTCGKRTGSGSWPFGASRSRPRRTPSAAPPRNRHRPAAPPAQTKPSRAAPGGVAQGGGGPPAGRGAAGGKPSSVPPGAAREAGLPPRGDGHPSTPVVAHRLQRSTRVLPDEQPGDVGIRTLPDLAPSGVCLAGRSPDRRWALTPPFHRCRRGRRLCISVALSLRFPSPGVTRRPALRSSDFPRPGDPAAAICPPPAAMLGQRAQAGHRWSPFDVCGPGRETANRTG